MTEVSGTHTRYARKSAHESSISGNSTDVDRCRLSYIRLKHLLLVSFMQPEPDTPRLLDVIDIPEPCQVPWETMTGHERIRFCGLCKKNVYNISEMSTYEAERFLQENLGSVCFGFNRRGDGTIVTDTCPKILKPVRNGFRQLKRAVAIIVGAFMAASAGFAQGDGPKYTKEQCATLAEGRFGALGSRGPLRFGVAPNVWRAESARLPAGYDVPKPVVPSFSLADLTTGDFALELVTEVYVLNGKTFISEEQRSRKTPQGPVHYTKWTGACIDGYTVSDAFRRGKEWVSKHDDRIAESYFKLSLKMLTRWPFEQDSEIQAIVRQYADLLKRNGRVKDAQLLLKRDVVTEVQQLHRSRARTVLGLDPAMLAPRPSRAPRQPRVNPVTAPFSAEPMLNPFVPVTQLQMRNTGEKKK